MNSVWRVVEIALSLQREAARAAARKAEHTAREAEQIAREAYRAGSTTRRVAERAAIDGPTPDPQPPAQP